MGSSMLWLGFLPVLAFVVLESFTGRKKALLCALGLGLGELIYTLWRFGSLDYLTYISFGFLGVFIGLSLKTGNDFYFKIQGALVSLVTAATLLIAWYALDRALLLDMAVKYIGLENLNQANPALTIETLSEILRVLSFHLPFWLILHGLLTIYAAANWSKWAWVAVRVPGFFVMLFLAGNFAAAGAGLAR